MMMMMMIIRRGVEERRGNQLLAWVERNTLAPSVLIALITGNSQAL